MMRAACVPLMVLLSAALPSGLVRAADKKSADAQLFRLDDAQSKSDDKDKKETDDKSAKSADKSEKPAESASDSEHKKTGDEKSSDSKSSDKKTKGDKSEAKADEKEKSAPTTYTVKKGPFKVDLKLDGVFESKRNSEITVHPDNWSDWVVKTVVAQGDTVKKGDTLVEFDTTKIDEQIRDSEADRKLAQLSIDQLTTEIRLLEQSMPLELKMAERSSRLAADDLDLFVKQDRELSERQANFMVKMYANNLDYSKEELKQLEKMYKGDEITKETEEIVLKRTRDQVEAVQFYYDLMKVMRDKTTKVELPRREDSLKLTVDRTALDLQKARTSLPIVLDKQRLELEKKKFEHDKAADKLAKMQHDRELMKITAPVDGMVYFGQCVHGQWSQAGALVGKLRKGGRISPDEVVLSVVDPSNVFVRATLPEKDLWQIHRGLTGSATPEGYGEQHLAASLDKFSMVPAPEGKYFGTVLVDFAQLPKDLPVPSPGMNCKIKLAAYSADSALTLPTKALQTDKLNDEQRYVWLSSGEGKPTRRNVTIGRRTDSTVEITDGLAEGDKVMREAPKDEE